MKNTIVAFTVCVAGVAAVPALRAQQDRMPRKHPVELTFSAGYFQPTGPSGAAGGFTLNRRPAWDATVHFGAYAKGGMWGAEVSAGYTPERVSQSGLGSHRTHLTYGTVRALVGRSPRRPGISIMAGAGLSVMHRQYSVTDFDVATTNAGGALSLFVRIPIDDQVGLRLDAEDLISHTDFGGGKKLHNDLVLTAGLGISW